MCVASSQIRRTKALLVELWLDASWLDLERDLLLRWRDEIRYVEKHPCTTCRKAAYLMQQGDPFGGLVGGTDRALCNKSPVSS